MKDSANPAGGNFTRIYTVRFDSLRSEDIPRVGGKNASLGEMYNELSSRGIHVPDGFATTAEGYRHYMHASGLGDRIRAILGGLNTQNTGDLQKRGSQIRQEILGAAMPQDLQEEILAAYAALGGKEHPLDVAVRSSATAEDLPDASFAGQQETFLNVRGDQALISCCHKSFASLFTDRAISYRADKGFDHFSVALSIGVQRMVRSDLAAAGVMFTLDTETGFRDVVLINAAYGLGENVVQGAVNPDEYCVFKPTLKSGHRPILKKVAGSKELRLIYEEDGGRMVKNVAVSPEDRVHFAITDDEVMELARWACIIEEHYSAKRGRPTPMDIEWAKDGRTGQMFIVQARPETVQSQKNADVVRTFDLKERGPILVTGRSVGERIASGVVRVIRDVGMLHLFKDGEILVAEKTDPDWEPIMKKAAAIVTNRGGRTCHAAILSRELGLPAIVGSNTATEVLHDGDVITVSCAEGDVGRVYKGALRFELHETALSMMKRPPIKIMLNVANPEKAFTQSFLPNDGVGLARMEFIISNYIKAHPMALLAYDNHTLVGPAVDQVAKLVAGHPSAADFFVDRLAQGISMIAAAFYPKDVILRLSDFKTNEYAHLVGGADFEPHEENPMLGFRGASRYYHPRYRDGFALECRAVHRVRQEMGLTNLKVMVPFCRTCEEGCQVLEEMAKHQLVRGVDGLEVYVMCEIPSNVILASEFGEIFDGFSIGSNDLTQLILGVDRDSEIVAPLFDERNPAVKRMISSVIAACKKTGKKVGICGQAPSDYPDFARFLLEEGIDSISLNPDSVIKTTLALGGGDDEPYG